MEVEAPRLHYVHPTYFEAGKVVEFIACGSNLDQPKLRFLVSFAGKYLMCDNYRVISHQKIRNDCGNSVVSSNTSMHEMFRIKIKLTHPEIFGPAFIEVENESGISNFIPILIGDKQICSELENLRGSLSYHSNVQEDKSNAVFTNTAFSKVNVARQIHMPDLLLDIAWLLKEPCKDCNKSFFGPLNVQRLNKMLQFSLQNELTSVLKAILKYVTVMIHEVGFPNSENLTASADLVQLLQYMENARKVIFLRTQHMGRSKLGLSYMEALSVVHEKNAIFMMTLTNQVERSVQSLVPTSTLLSVDSDESTSHVPEDRHCSKISFLRLGYSCWPTDMPSPPITRRWPAVFAMCTFIMCFLLCIILLNPHKASDLVVYMGRHSFTNFNQ